MRRWQKIVPIAVILGSFLFAFNFYLSGETSAGTWTIVELVSTESTSTSSAPAIAVDADGNVHVVWEDYTNYGGSGTDADIFSKRWNASEEMWTTTEVVSTGLSGASSDPAIAVDPEGNVHVVWADASNLGGHGAPSDILYRRWNASENAWRAMEVVSTDEGEHVSPDIATDENGNAHVVWANGTEKILYRKLDASSDSWLTIFEPSLGTNAPNFNPAIAVHVDQPLVVWECSGAFGDSGEDRDILFNYDYGDGWYSNRIEVVSTGSWNESRAPAICSVDLGIFGGVIYIAWQEYNSTLQQSDIMYRSRTWPGGWQDSEIVSAGLEGLSASPDVTAFLLPGLKVMIHVVWADQTDFGGAGADWDIFSRCLNLTSGIWTPPELLSLGSSGASGSPSIAVDADGGIHVAWHDSTNDYVGSGPDTDIFYRKMPLTPPKSTWSVVEVVSTESTSTSSAPDIAVDADGNVHVVWEDYTNYGGSGTDADIFYKRWNASAECWMSTEVVSAGLDGASTDPALAVDPAGNVHVVWVDTTNYGGSGNDADIFYRQWNATLKAWSAITVVSENDWGDSSPDIAVDSDHVHVVWENDQDFKILHRMCQYNGLAGWEWEFLTHDVSSEGENHNPAIVLDPSNLGYPQVVWEKWDDVKEGRSIQHSSFDGDSFQISEVVSTGSWNDSISPAIAMDEFGNAFIAWQEYNSTFQQTEVLYRNHTEGEGWGEIAKVSAGMEGASTSPPPLDIAIVKEMEAGGGEESAGIDYIPSSAELKGVRVSVAWASKSDYGGAGTDWDIFSRCLDIPTGTWYAPELLSVGSTGTSSHPSLAIDAGGSIHVTWDDATSGYCGSGSDKDIFYRTMPLTPPTSPAIEINGGAAQTSEKGVSLALAAIHATEMCFSHDTLEWSSWEPFALTKTWALSPGAGTKTVYAWFRNIAGEVTATDTITLLSAVECVNTSAPGRAYGVGERINVTVAFTEPVWVTGTPQLTLNTGGPGAVVNYAGGSGSTQLNFTYTVVAGDLTPDLDYLGTDSLALNGGAIKDVASNEANLTLPAPGGAGSLSYGRDIAVDTAAPKVLQVSSPKANGIYGIGTEIPITITFNETVYVAGTPRLALQTGVLQGVAVYAGGSGTMTLTFTYTVGVGHASEDLDYATTSSLSLAGGAITDGTGNPANLLLPPPGAPGSLADQKDIAVDGIAPVVLSVSSTNADGTYEIGATILITITFSEPVYVTRQDTPPQLLLETGDVDAIAFYTSGSGSATLTFLFTVTTGQVTPDLDYGGIDALTLNGGTIRDALGCDANLTLPAPGAVGSLGGNKEIAVAAPADPLGWVIAGGAVAGLGCVGGLTAFFWARRKRALRAVAGKIDTLVDGFSDWEKNGAGKKVD